jgi:capsular exopolysaccharide synthesis family protein
LISITSTISGEGKTFIAINLASIIAFSNKKVIVLDLDMRKPKIHKAFNVENKEGMSTLLIGKAKLQDCIRKSPTKGLDYITAGPIPPNPSELLLNPQLDVILEELKKEYDVIIADNPPVGLVTDGIIMLQKADFPIYVFRADYSKKQFIQNADRLKNENHFDKLSVILNNVDISRNRYGYNYGYGYGYGYGYTYGYYDDEKKKRTK